MEWTKEQQQVIKQRHSDILVSAAAGSGKTAVLVERIIARVCDKSESVDIDRILVVTFTKAAAREMKERIYLALEKAAAANPDDEHLAMQLALVHNAQISTIDGFCQYLIHNYFHEIGLDPASRIGDEGELVLLQNEIMEELLEEQYETADADFLALTDAFASRDRDDAVVGMIFGLHETAMSYPYPHKWLAGLSGAYEAEDEDTLAASGWMTELVLYCKGLLAGLQTEAGQLLTDLCEGGQEHPYAEAVRADLQLISHLLACEDYRALQQAFSGIRFAALSRKKLPDEDTDERERYKNRRDAVKKELSAIQKDLLAKPLSEVYTELAMMAPYVRTLLALTAEYGRRYAAAKEARGVMDFSDLEHFALSVLVDEKTGERTPAAQKLSEYYAEIMVDEYQDSNFLQEMLLSSITKEADGAHNYFMVGDVKQSIYRFRQARPDIFIGKYRQFGGDDHNETLIGLDKNFRSRASVTDAVNAVFFPIMHPDMGGIEYDKAQSLKCGAAYPPDETNAFVTEILVSDAEEIEAGEFDSKHDYEAAVIATRIRKLLREAEVTDKETGKLRPVRLSDIAILHRSANAVGRNYQEILKGYGIPAQIVSVTGYFSTIEVETMLALLRVLNNPAQDIALASVMKSALFSFSDEELARMRAAYPKEPFHRAVRQFAGETRDEKAVSFLEKLSRWRGQVGRKPLYELLSGILRETQYLSYISALTGGDVRRKNIEKLMELSVAYENTSYKGLFYFVRYIERLQKYEQDMGQAGTGSTEDAVSILTIHKSKGLEYPVVFLAGCGQKFRNNTDSMVLHPDFGIGLHAIDIKKRTKQNTLYRAFLSRMNTLEERGEELRVLYVAMTRAKEKLIVTAVLSNMEKTFAQKEAAEDGCLPLVRRLHASNYLELILPGTRRRPGLFAVQTVTAQDLILAEVEEQAGQQQRLIELQSGMTEVSEENKADCIRRISFSYPHPISSETKVKYSVSELKRRAMAEAFADEETENLFDVEEEEAYVPMFISGRKPIVEGAQRGTAVHRYLECFDFTVSLTDGAYRGQLSVMREDGRLSKDEEALLPEQEIITFLQSDLAGRMHSAAVGEHLEKEAAFVMADVPSHFIDEAEPSDEEEPILVQGIIDVFFEEDDGIVLVDYKTDRIRTGEELIRRYEKQMRLYADALERTQDKRVKEIILYSFALGESVPVV